MVPKKQCVHQELTLLSLCEIGPGGIETHAWGLMSTVMTEVLSKADWLKLWDHVLSNSPPFFMFLLLSYLLYFRAQITSAETRQHTEGITRRCNPLDLNKVLLLLLHCNSSNHQTKSAMIVTKKKIVTSNNILRQWSVHEAIGHEGY